MTRVAVVKPDHLGDLVLAAPAIRAVERHFGGVTLFVAGPSRTLANFLFPSAALHAADLPHLARRPVEAPLRLAAELSTFDLVLWLRDDPPIRRLAAQVRADQDFATGNAVTHETVAHRRMLARHCPGYSRSALFGPQPIRWPASIRSAGLCVSAGFPANRWPSINWLRLGAILAQRHIAVSLIGGPVEQAELALLSKCFASLGMPHRTIAGTPDFAALLDAIAEIDVVIATDGGTAHLCSLTKPVLSLFGASPWRRYAPFGRDNIVVTRELACAPCVQFDTEFINACMTRECLGALEPEIAADVLAAAGEPPGGWRKLVVQRGASHLQDCRRNSSLSSGDG